MFLCYSIFYLILFAPGRDDTSLVGLLPQGETGVGKKWGRVWSKYQRTPLILGRATTCES